MPIIGIEPMTYCLRDSCSTAELSAILNVNFLYRLNLIIERIYVKNRSKTEREIIKGISGSFQRIKENIVDSF